MKRIAIIAALLAGVSLLCAPMPTRAEDPPKKEVRIGLTLMDYNFDFFQKMLAMAKKTAADEHVQLLDFDGQGNAEVQMKEVEDMIAKKVDAIFLNPVDSAAIAPAVLEANKAGIPVITVDVRSASGKVAAHIASNNVDIGRLAGNYAVDYLTKKYGKASGHILIEGFPQITSMRDRVVGFKEVLAKSPAIELTEIDVTHLDIPASMAVAEDQLTRYGKGKVDIYFGSNSMTGLGIKAAAETTKRSDVAIIAVDDETAFLQALKDPSSPFMATVVQYPTEMGKLGVEYAVKAAQGENFGDTTKEVATPVKLISKDNIDAYEKEVNAILAEIKPFRN
jgi:ribose transport system substrate-binding protein